MQGTTEHGTESGKPSRYWFVVKHGVKQILSTVSKLGTGILSQADSEDYFVCKLCFRLVETEDMVRHLKTCRILPVDFERVQRVSEWVTSLLSPLSITQLLIIRSCLIFSRPHFEQECPQLTKDLQSALDTVNELIKDSSSWISEENSPQEWRQPLRRFTPQPQLC